MNKANISVAVITLAALLAVASAQTNRPTPSLQIGRYQLFGGEYDMAGSSAIDKVILRIDTTTGEVDELYHGKKDNGDLVDEWLPTGTQKNYSRANASK
jgi:hypothetical protein